MNPLLSHIIEFAMKSVKSPEVRDAALDEIYLKLLILPLQRAWRSKLDARGWNDEQSVCPNYVGCHCGRDHDYGGPRDAGYGPDDDDFFGF